MAKYLVNTDYSFRYNDIQYSKSDENIVVESNFKPTNPMDIHKAIAKLNNISWFEWGKVDINYMDINRVTKIDIINLDDKDQTKTIELDGEYEVRVAWSFNPNDEELPIDEFYDYASDNGNVCSFANSLINLVDFPYATYRLALVSTKSTHIEEIPTGSYLKLYTGIITNKIGDNKTIISRQYLREFLNFLSDKGYLELKETTKDLDDLLDEFENLPEY